MNDRHATLSRLVRSLFNPASSTITPHVGVEIELIPIRFVGEDAQPVTIDELKGMLPTAGSPLAEGRMTYEPGGQLEFSPPPGPTVRGLMRQITTLLDDVRCSAAARGVTFKAEGIKRWLTSDQIGLQKDTGAGDHFGRNLR